MFYLEHFFKEIVEQCNHHHWRRLKFNRSDLCLLIAGFIIENLFKKNPHTKDVGNQLPVQLLKDVRAPQLLRGN